MTREEWKLASGGLRKLLNELPNQNPREGGRIRKYHDRFGALYNRRYRFWHIWNVDSENVIATIRFRRGRIIVRYRENSRYSYIIKLHKWQFPNTRVMVYPSRKLFRHKEWVKNNIHEQTRVNWGREMMEREEEAKRRAFLRQRQELPYLNIDASQLTQTATFSPISERISQFNSSTTLTDTSLAQMSQDLLNQQAQARQDLMREQLSGIPPRGLAVETVSSGTSLSESELRQAISYLRHYMPDVERVETMESADGSYRAVRGYDSSGRTFDVQLPRILTTISN